MKFGLILDQNKKEAIDLSVDLEEFMISKGHFLERDKDNFSEVDVVIVLGGDGLLLHSACEHAEHDVPFVGINLGRLGFLAAAEAVDWHEAADRLIKGKYEVSKRITLEATVLKEDSERIGEAAVGGELVYRALNEAVVKGTFRIVELEILVKGQKFISIAGDGVIVATQTGSTAYSLSSGGPIVDPAVDCFLVTPVNAHGLPIPSVVLSADDLIEVKVIKGEEVFLVIDGQEHVAIDKGQRIRIVRGKNKVKFAYFDKQHFLKSLNAKFGLASRLMG